MRARDHLTDQEREEYLHFTFEKSITHDIAKAVWKVENREANLNGEDFSSTLDYEAAFADWVTDRYARPE